ncbi:hypothetical protein GGX14DRAFT_398912 [Mycena pura]|uniref:Uncharacterized protein n=1 Tax=Mycena pura TaxID=153505 RepID=A0AAD6V9N0_9AGAR|nr:hypothetical protein GGX14DRAFT_398912 [Mycena pura]
MYCQWAPTDPPRYHDAYAATAELHAFIMESRTLKLVNQVMIVISEAKTLDTISSITGAQPVAAAPKKPRYMQPVDADIGDIANLGEIGFFVCSAKGRWDRMECGSRHPYASVYFLDGKWVSESTWYHKKQGKRSRNRVSVSVPTPPAKKLCNKAPVAVNPANAWVAAAAVLWKQEPLNFYAPVKDKVSEVFEYLCSLPAQIPTLETFPVTHVGPAPSSANVLEDLRHLTGHNVPYSELSGGYSNKELPGEEVLELVSQSELRAPWRNGQRVVALFDLSPLSNSGLRSCKLNLAEIASSCLLPGAVFTDFNFAYGNELGMAFPGKSERQLKKQGKVLFTSSCWVPTGWFNDIHADRSTLSQLIIHHDGEKILGIGTVPYTVTPAYGTSILGALASQAKVVFEDHQGCADNFKTSKREALIAAQRVTRPPASSRLGCDVVAEVTEIVPFRRIYGPYQPVYGPYGYGDLRLADGHHLVLEALGKLQGLRMVHADHPCTFILPPFTLHCVITMRTSSHSGAFFAHADHWATEVTGLEFTKHIFSMDKFGRQLAQEMINCSIREQQFWRRVMKNNRDAKKILDMWREDMENLVDKFAMVPSSNA